MVAWDADLTRNIYYHMSLQPETEVAYRARIASIHADLGISAEYELNSGLALQQECEQLSDAGLDIMGRPALLERETLAAWQRMQQQAAAAGVTLYMVSAFRSAEYQKGIFDRKLGKGLRLKDILKVNAAPGFSEHHTGQAIDIGTRDVDHLSETFEDSPAFSWLEAHAGEFGFSLSFPRNNAAGLLYEPWHWKYCPRVESGLLTE